MNKLSSAICIAVVLTTPVVALAHHAAAMFETEKTVTVSGTVEEFAYVNPHAWLYVVVTDDKGEETLWGFQAEGPSTLMRAGIKNNALQPGDLVTVTARPLRDGRPAGALVGQRHKGGRDGAGAAPDMGQGLVATPSQLRVAAFPVPHFMRPAPR
jgi:hypothetical protein